MNPEIANKVLEESDKRDEQYNILKKQLPKVAKCLVGEE
jgi:hypothetical protein